MIRASATALLALGLNPPPVAADTPMDYLHTAGPAADPITALGWGVTAIAIGVTAIIAILLTGALARRRPRLRDASGLPPVTRDPSGIRWIGIGTGLSTAVLFGALAWTFVTFAAVSKRGPDDTGLTVAVIGHQWWWEVRYAGGNAGGGFSTANELHIPVGQRVQVRLDSADVIHSFWIPKLAGKTDAIPGQTNLAWLQADRPGVYLGQCAEYCGMQHAHMGLRVVADAPADFQAWLDRQRRTATPPRSEALAGQGTFVNQCGLCHTVRGTGAQGIVGPDLTHVMSRDRIGAGTLPNRAGPLAGWIANAQAQKPGCGMPPMELPGPDLQAVLAYLQTLD